MREVQIRTATLADHEDVQDVRRRASLSNEHDRAHMLADPETLLYDSLSLRDGRTRVATVDGLVVGFATTAGDHELELEALFVDPPAMRTGVGRALVLDLAAGALARGIDRIDVTANTHALAFYEALGFVADGPVRTAFGEALRMHLDVPSAAGTQ